MIKVILAGRMDIDGAASVDARFADLAAAAQGLIIDLSGVSFLASMGLRTLMLSARSLAARGHSVALAAPHANVVKVLRASGVDEVMPIFDTVDAAAAALAS